MPTLKPNEIFAKRYYLQIRIGVGGYSEVWQAKDTKADNLDVALKVFAPEKGLDKNSLQVFSKEFSLVFNLIDPNILRPSHYDEWEDSPYIVMPYCKNGSTCSKIGKMSEHELAHFMLQAASALAYLHNQVPPIIHQDIKPDNFLIDNNGNYLLADFGISSKIRRTLTKSLGDANTSAGTLAYMPPEKFSADKQIIKAGDIFSLGATMYELLTGDFPFGVHGGMVMLSGAQIPNLPSKFSPELNIVLKSCMAKDTWDRPTAEKLIVLSKDFINNRKWTPVTLPNVPRITVQFHPNPLIKDSLIKTKKNQKSIFVVIIVILSIVVISFLVWNFWPPKTETLITTSDNTEVIPHSGENIKIPQEVTITPKKSIKTETTKSSDTYVDDLVGLNAEEYVKASFRKLIRSDVKTDEKYNVKQRVFEKFSSKTAIIIIQNSDNLSSTTDVDSYTSKIQSYNDVKDFKFIKCEYNTTGKINRLIISEIKK